MAKQRVEKRWKIFDEVVGLWMAKENGMSHLMSHFLKIFSFSMRKVQKLIILDENLQTRLTMPKQRVEKRWNNFDEVAGLWRAKENRMLPLLLPFLKIFSFSMRKGQKQIIFYENLKTRLTMPKQRTEQVWKNFKKVCGLWKENESEKFTTKFTT